MVVGGPRYKVARRRRREGKTNYRKRYTYVFSGRIRLVVRKTNKYIEAKIVDCDPKGDLVKVSAHSIELIKKYGWKGSGKSTPAAYLLGYLIGKRAIEKGLKDAVLDIGLYRVVKQSKLFAVVKGAIDAGLKVPVSEETLPSEGRIRGEHIANYAKMLKESNPERYNRQFSKIINSGLLPEEYVAHFESVLNAIKNEKKG
ncbi:50S ribosomal protein L18 [Fervidicoccus sp.]|uniref:50S ribosomal protein L18 n=1 Tax=Fervidicoccus sp. TaxID=2060324 RepID=UPI003D0ECD04